MGFIIQADNRVKVKENEKKKKRQFLGELKKLSNLKVTLIPIVVAALEKKRLKVLEIREREGIIQIISFK